MPGKVTRKRRQVEDLSPTQVGRLSDLHELDQRRLLITFMRAHGMTLKEVCNQLGSLSIPVRQNVAVKDLHQAGFDKWIVTRFAREMFKEELLTEIAIMTHHRPWTNLEKSLSSLRGSVLKNLRVVYSGGKAKPRDQEWPAIIDRFADNSAWLIQGFLEDSKRVAVCWGSTVANIVNALSALRIPVDPGRRAIPVIPTAGQPLGQHFRNAGIDSTTIARLLSIYFNGQSSNQVPSLDNVWPVIPRKFIDSPEVRELVRDIDSHRKIFGDGPQDKSAMLSRADTILASCGSFHNWNTFVAEWMSGDDGVDVTKVAIGDFGGAIVPKPGVPESEFEAVARLWTGITLEHFKLVAVRSPGVILCAVGRNKGRIALELVRRGLVTTLVVDNQLASEIEAQIKTGGHPLP
jgi:DNA-binding transcriptional regulator LsrR (DeoR family)